MRSNSIRVIQVQNVQLTSHDAKVQALTTFFSSIIGTRADTSWDFDITALFNGSQLPTTALTEPFSEQETKLALLSMDRNSARAVPAGVQAVRTGPKFQEAPKIMAH